MPGSGTTMMEFLAQAGLRETGAMDDVAQAARDIATVLEVRSVPYHSLPFRVTTLETRVSFG